MSARHTEGGCLLLLHTGLIHATAWHKTSKKQQHAHPCMFQGNACSCNLFSLPTYLPIYLSTYLSLHLSIDLSVFIYPYLSLSIFIYLYLYLYLSIYLSLSFLCLSIFIYLSIYPYLSLFIFIYLYLSLFLSLSLSIYLSIYYLKKTPNHMALPPESVNNLFDTCGQYRPKELKGCMMQRTKRPFNAAHVCASSDVPLNP